MLVPRSNRHEILDAAGSARSASAFRSDGGSVKRPYRMESFDPKEGMTLPGGGSFRLGIARRYPSWSLSFKRLVNWRLLPANGRGDDEHWCVRNSSPRAPSWLIPASEDCASLGWSGSWTRAVQHGALGIERGRRRTPDGRLYFVPTEVGETLAADRAHAHSGEQRIVEGSSRTSIFFHRFWRRTPHKMDLLDVEGQQSEEVGVVSR